jgi:CheY-like chemotaxis protein
MIKTHEPYVFFKCRTTQSVGQTSGTQKVPLPEQRPKLMSPPGSDDPQPKPLAGLRCLVLDDDLLIALDIEHVLRSAGAASVTSVSNVVDAMAALHNEAPFTIAVLDIALGSDDSMAVPAALQARGVPFIFLTGMGGDDARARRYPEAPVVDKPYQLDELLAALRRALRRR